MTKTVCADGDDCPCWTSEKARPPPVVSTKAPLKVTVEPGKTVWACSCGQSKKFPMCDGSHKAYNAEHGTSFASIPVKNETEAAKDFWLCQCGHSKNRPFCDGSHAKVKP